ncbi:GerAB/ArcD/ProY family transporter [Metabacillus herbersteinensis]|uniref:GerAB/ArcD/ProY family transporter n=1 Tax=Metabacillus herbersteinensis TaxID=283816 RepID=A0ABV6GGK6_9BACI
MVQSKIQPIQLFVLMVLFELGSAVVVGLGLEAKQDAWIAILLGMTGGIVLFSLYVYLYTQYPTLPLTNYLEKIVGKFIGRILATVYICLFLYIAARVLRDLCDLLLTNVLYETPILAVAIMMMLAISFGCYLGFEVIARTAEIFFPWVLFFGFLFLLFIFISGLPKVENLQPVLESGWKPVFQAAFPTIVSFPFGETIVFAIFFPYLNHKKQVITAGFSAIIFSGILLTSITTIMISVFGPFFVTKITFPLLESVGKVNIGEVFQRLDPIALILLIIGGFFKITVFFCGAVEGFSSLVKKPNLTKFSIPIMAIAVIVMAILMADNYVEHIKIGLDIVPYILFIPLFMVIPFLLVVIVMIKKKITKKKQTRG